MNNANEVLKPLLLLWLHKYYTTWLENIKVYNFFIFIIFIVINLNYI